MVINQQIYHVKGLRYIIRSAHINDANELSHLRVQLDGETENLDRESGEGYMDESDFGKLKSSLKFLGLSCELSKIGIHTAEVHENLSLSDRIDSLIAARNEARKQKNWAESDRIRDELAAMGIQLKDAKNPETGEMETTWEVKR